MRRRREGAEPVAPAELVSFAHSALDGRRIDAELAELSFDSLLEPEPVPAGRRLVFCAPGLELELGVEHAGEGRTLLGRLEPATAVRVEAEADGGAIVASGEAGVDGRFRLQLARGGRMRLVLALLVRVETSWVTF